MPTGWWDGPLAYDRVPETFNIVTRLVDRHVAAGHGEAPAIVTPERTVSYAELAAAVDRAARMLERLGVQREQRVALLLPDAPEFVYVFLGAMKAGMVPVPLSTLGSAEETAYALADSRAVAVVADAALYDRLAAACRGVSTLRVHLVAGDAPPGALAFDAAHAAEAPGYEAAPTHRDDMAYWLYSSGTTGRPKAVVHLHHDMLFCVEPYLHHVLGLTARDRTFAVPRLFFSYGLTSCLYLPLAAGASTVLLRERPDPRAVVATWARLRPTVFFAIPTSYVALLRVMEGTQADVASIRLCVSAGEPLPPAVYRRWVERTGVECLDGLGATEVGYIYISNRPGAVRAGASGRLLSGYAARILDPEGREVPPGTEGELWVSGESLAAGYWNRHEQTRAVFVGAWYRTGDRYLVDADGYYVFRGRADDLLRVGARWVSPLEVEGCLLEHPAVQECAVVGGRDVDGLEQPHAYVVLHPGVAATGLEETLRAHARARLAAFKVPRWVTVVPALPKTATGKIQRFRLRTG